jgi:hypothetical protein
MKAVPTRFRRRTALAGLVAGAALYVGPGFVLHASAEVGNNGLNCQATVAGVDVAGVNSNDAAQAIRVSEHSQVAVAMTADSTISNYTVDMAFSFKGWQVASGTSTSNSWSNGVNVDSYSRYGIGLYRVSSVSSGPAGVCTAAAMIRVEGAPIPGTVAGDAAAAAGALGLLGLAGGAIRAARGPKEEVIGLAAMSGGPSRPVGEMVRPTVTLSQLQDNQDRYEEEERANSPCHIFFTMAFLMTIGAMVTGGGGTPVVARQPRATARMRWHPVFSWVSVISGVLAALGGLVLLQQYSILFPSTTVVSVGLGLGVLAGLLVPSLMRLIRVAKWNRGAAAIDAAIARATAGAAPAAAQPPAAAPPAPPPA